MNEKNTIYYTVPYHCSESFYKIESVFDIREDGEYIAQDAGEDYFDNHDGWESSWPLEIALHDCDMGPIVGLYDVHMESIPSFSAVSKAVTD